MKKGLIATACITLLGACASTPPATAPASSTGPAAAATPAKSAPTSIASSTASSQGDASGLLNKERSVYFDFDNYSVKPEYQAALNAHGKYLATKTAAKIKVEGNADERGSREYNLALGQKRAEAVKQSLLIDGAKDGQIETVSWGKEKPKATGHDEADWAQNRRADIVYP